MNNDTSNTQETPQLGFGQTILLGWKVALSEVHWHILRGLRSWEIRQIEDRLGREYQTLGRLVSAQNTNQEQDDQTSEIELCQQQINFLEKEVTFLKQELQNLRESIVEQRCHKWSLS
jgi:hypothetical protein